MASTAVGTHAGTASLSLMSCVRESSPQESIPDIENDKNVASKKKFWNPRKWFKRKNNKVCEDTTLNPEIIDATVQESLRSRSTSEISETDEPIRRRSGTPIHPGLSVSHDSIFHSPNSGSELDLDEAQSSSSLSIQHHPTQSELRLQTELSERLRIRRGRGDTSEDDEGLPRSPCCNSPTATEGLLEKTVIKNHPTKSHSTCSDGSLLSMGSSEIEEDSFGHQSSQHSSKLSLYEKKSVDQDFEWELGPSSAAAPLNHSAAHHKVAVRPKRTHGAPRRKRMQQIPASALPTTPEVNEDSSIRSLTPETSTKETVTELYSSSISMSKTRTENQLKCSSLPPGLAAPGSESKLNRSRSSAGSKSQDVFNVLGEEDEDKDDKKDQSIFARLFPRRSGKKKKNKQDYVSTPNSTLLSSNTHVIESNSFESTSSYSSKTSERRSYGVDSKPIPRSGPASRQRIQPIDIPATPDAIRRDLERIPLPKDASDKSPLSTSPLQLELENHFRQKKASLSTSPNNYMQPNLDSPPGSPSEKRPLNYSMSPPLQSVWTDNVQYRKSSSTTVFESKTDERIKLSTNIDENKAKFILNEHFKNKSRNSDESIKNKYNLNEDSKNKIKFPGLSSLQQRVLQHDDTVDTTFKSLTDFTSSESTNSKSITKSHSFKSKTNDNYVVKDTSFNHVSSLMSKSDVVEKQTNDMSTSKILKTVSLDSMKNLQCSSSFSQHKNLVSSDSSESLESSSSAKTNSTEYLDSLNPANSITISGPSHTSVVPVSAMRDAQIVDSIVKSQTSTTNTEKATIENQSLVTSTKEEQISVTKIQLKRESLQVTQNGISSSFSNNVPEFLNVHLNKVDAKPTTNVVLSTTVNSVKPEIENESKPKTVFNSETPKEQQIKIEMDIENCTRKFSQDDIEIIDKNFNEENIITKNIASPNVVITSMTPPASSRIYKKYNDNNSQNSQVRKSSLVSPTTDTKAKINLRTKSNSLDIVDSLKQSNENSEMKLEKSDGKQKGSSTTDLQDIISNDVVLRRKSLVKQKQDEEPELMKVFARRSLKLKDTDDIAHQVLVMVEDAKSKEDCDNISKSRDSDKENLLDSPPEERRKPVTKELEKPKEPLTETKFVETTEVKLRKPINNKLFMYQQKSISLNISKSNEVNNEKVQKNSSFTERPKTEISEKITNKTWITTVNKESELKEEVHKKITCDEVITDLSPKSDFINEDFPTIPKNFNQRKAEWEKRAQEALKKNVP